MDQRLPNQRLLVGWRIFSDYPPTIDLLMDRIASLPRTEALRFLANFDAALFQASLQDRNGDHVILGAFGKGLSLNRALQVALIEHPNTTIFSEIQVRTLAMLCNAYASDTAEIQYSELHYLFECCLLFNSLFIDSQVNSDIEYARAVEVRSMLLDTVSGVLPQERNIAYLVWLSKRSPALGYDILDYWREARGWSLSDYYIAGWEALGPLVKHNVDAPATSALMAPDRNPDPKTAIVLSQWLKSHTLSSSQPIPTIPLAYSDDIQSRRQPFAEIRPGVYACVSRQSLSQLLGDTLFFDAADCIPNDRPDQREAFFVQHGEFLNSFVLDIARRAASADDVIDGDFDVPGRGKATDLIWLHGDVILLCEVVAKRFNFEHSVHGLSESSINNDVQQMLLGKIAQLKWNVAALLNGEYSARFPGFDPSKTVVQPVLVTMNFSPRLSTLRDELMIMSSGELESLGTLPLEVITLADFQVLDGFATVGLTLSDLLEEKQKTPLSPLMSFRDFITQYRSESYGIAFKYSVKRLSTVINELINLPGQAPSIVGFALPKDEQESEGA
jgi:hypothetical protein